MQPLLKRRIQPVVRRIQLRRALLAVAAVFALAAVAVIVLIVLKQNGNSFTFLPWQALAAITIVLAFIAGLVGFVTAGNLDRAVEAY